MTRVAIVGGGPGGLMTACLIDRKFAGGCSTTVFDADAAPGGKLRTRTFATAPVPYEAGTAEIYDYSCLGNDPLQGLIADLGLSTREMTGQTVIFDDTVLQNDGDIARHLGRSALDAIRAFRRRAADLVPLHEWHPSDWRTDVTHPWTERTCADLLETIDHPVARRYLAVTAHSDLATEPHLTTGLNGLRNLVMAVPGYVRYRSIDGGMSRLAERLIANANCDFVLNSRVTRIERTVEGTWRITSMRGGLTETDDFDVVVLALPASQLCNIEWRGEHLRRAMSAHIARFDRPGHYLRVSLLFRSPFWKDTLAGSWFMVDDFGGACVYNESSRFDTLGHGVLGFLIAGNNALAHMNQDETTLARRVIESLPPALRPRAAAQFMEVRTHRWCGGVSGQPGGLPICDPRLTHSPDAGHLPGLLMVGDYLFDSTLNGVYRSADLTTELLEAHVMEGAASPQEALLMG
jgi:hypothetical protein